MSVTSDQRQVALEAIARRDAAWDAFIAAMLVGDGTASPAAIDMMIIAEAALARAIPM